MATDLKISQLASGNPAQNGDLIPADRSGSNFSVTAASIAALAVPPTVNLLLNNRIWKAVPNSGTLGDIIGFSPQSLAQSSGLIAATATDTNYNTYSTSALAGNQASLCFTGATGSGLNPNVFQIYSTQTLKAAKWQVKLTDTTNIRVWIAFSDVFSGNIASLEADLPNLNVIGFRYSTAAGDTNWKAVCGVAGTCTVVDTGIAADTASHKFGLSVSPTSIVFSIDGNTVATITTHIPANTVLMGDVVAVDNIGLTNVKTFAINSFATAE